MLLVATRARFLAELRLFVLYEPGTVCMHGFANTAVTHKAVFLVGDNKKSSHDYNDDDYPY
jgi:hypothetical protein